jgi:hypothetical protein
MSNYLKKSIFCLMILMMPYMNSASKAMDDGDYEGSSVHIHKASLMTDDQKDVSSSAQQSMSSQVASLEESPTSWASYMISPVKSTIQMANEFMELARNNPKLAMVVGIAYTLQFAEALPYCACYCCYKNPGTVGCLREPVCYDYTNTINSCQNLCNKIPLDYDKCIWNATKC